MANHSFIHFSRKVTCAQVADCLNEFMANRYAGLGHVEAFTDTQNVSVSVFFKLFKHEVPVEYYYWSRSPGSLNIAQRMI